MAQIKRLDRFQEGILAIARMLIMENDVQFNNELADALQAQGDEIQQCSDDEQGVTKALTEQFDLIIVSVNLSPAGENRIIQRIRNKKPTPIMVLAHDNSTDTRIDFFKQGVDDCLPKPLNLTELKLRVNVLLQRHKSAANRSAIITVDALTLQKTNQQVSFNGHELTFTPIQFRLLWLLVQNRNQTLTKAYLYQTVLDREFYPYDRSLDMHLSRVRKKLIEKGMLAERLKTMHGKGYCFT